MPVAKFIFRLELGKIIYSITTCREVWRQECMGKHNPVGFVLAHGAGAGWLAVRYY